MSRIVLPSYFYGNNLQKIFAISAFSAGLVFLTGLTMFVANNPAVSKSILNPKSSFAAVVAPSGFSTSSSILGVNIANNGSMLVRGAVVTAVSADTLEAKMSWGSANFAWVIQTTGATKFLSQQGQKQTISDVKVGDTVTVTGKLASDSNQYVINAEFVREQ